MNAAAVPDPDAALDPSQMAQSEYRIGPFDTLEFSVFRVPELTKTTQVSAKGRVVLPLIGTVVASGKTPTELEEEVAQKLGAKYLQSPQVSVSVKEALSQRITVSGAVRQPGVFPVMGDMTLMQVIARAQGLDSVADPSGVVVFRQSAGVRMAARFDYNAVSSGKAPDPLLAPGDIIVVDQSGTRATLRDITQGLPIVSVFLPLLLL